MRRPVVVLVSLALLVVVVVWFLHRSDLLLPQPNVAPALVARSGTHGDPPASAAIYSASEAAVPVSQALRRVSGVPLPPANTPLAAMADELLRRAQQGDTQAACRLGIELLRCRKAAEIADSMGDTPPRDARPDQLALANEIMDVSDSCGGVDPALLKQGGDWLHRAARAGEVDAMLLYADGASLDHSGMFSLLGDPALDTWRQEAPAMLQAALRQGEPGAAWILWMGSQPGNSTALLALIPEDPVAAATYQLLLSKLKPNMRPPDLGAFPPAQRAQIERSADADFQAYFGGHPMSPHRAMTRAWGALSPFTKEDEAPCGE